MQNNLEWSYLGQTHDLSLPDWGPYTKKYGGISHLADKKRGLRFDLSVFGGIYQETLTLPNARQAKGFHPWEAASNLSYYAFRHIIQEQAEIYADVSFCSLADDAYLIRQEIVNQTNQAQTLSWHCLVNLSYPELPIQVVSPRPQTEIMFHQVELPPDTLWLSAIDYADLQFALSRPTDNLGYDGYYWAEQHGNGYVGGVGVGIHSGDKISYRFSLADKVDAARLLMRYRLNSDSKTAFQFVLDGEKLGELVLIGTDKFNTGMITLGNLTASEYNLELVLEGGENTSLELDGLAIGRVENIEKIKFSPLEWQARPEISFDPQANHYLINLPTVATCYGLTWAQANGEVKTLSAPELESYLQNNYKTVQNLLTEKESDYHGLLSSPSFSLQSGERKIFYAVIANGESAATTQKILQTWQLSEREYEKYYQEARAKRIIFPAISAQKYAFSQERMSATLLTNLVYPIYLRRNFIKHYTPGRFWDSLYTWDSGFIGLGLAELDLARAIECLNTYLTEPGDQHGAFIHHGSPLPVQHYLFLEIWHKTQSLPLVEYFYPRLRQYYLFLSGQLGSSTTRRFKSNLLVTWDYFYNSGGWDDYPPQVYLHTEKLENQIAPVVTTAHVIRVAKILQMVAFALGLETEVAGYQVDIDLFGAALQNYAWDAASGYFGYVCHNSNGEPTAILRHFSGENFNKGLDGISPLIAGICTPEQTEKILGHLSSETELWSSSGLSTVSQSAPYYLPDGYWNGAVWLPHQWFLWKSLLDIGQAELAHQIAWTALEKWQSTVNQTYNCYERFVIATGQGAGWPQFSGLSSPVLNWYAAYYQAGRITGGFNFWLEWQNYAEAENSLFARFRCFGTATQSFSLIITMPPSYHYQVSCNGELVKHRELQAGILELTLPYQAILQELLVTKS